MATSSIVNTLGAGSGIDIKTLAENLVDAERAPRKQRIDDKIAQTEAKISGYSAVKFALSELKTAFEKLNDASDFTSIQPNNTEPSAFSVSAGPLAQAGSYSIQITKTALAQRTASNSFAARNTLLNNGMGFNMELNIGGEIKTIAVTTTTPAGLVSAINGAELGVSAQLINTGSSFQIVLSGETGASNSFSMSAVATTPPSPTSALENGALVVTAGFNATAVSISYPDENDMSNTISLPLVKGVDGLWRPADENFEPPANMTIVVERPEPVLPVFNQSLQTATDASFKVNGLTVSRSSNTVNDVIEGVTLELYTETSGSARLDLNRDTASIKDNLKALVTAYKDFDETLRVLADRESEVEIFGGALAGDNLLQNVRNQVRTLITNPSDTPGTTIVAARNVGLSFDRNGMLQLDEAKLDAALQNNFDEVVLMFSANTNNKSVYSDAPAGVAGHAFKTLDEMLRSTGLIDKQSATAQKKIGVHKAELEKLQDRMDMLLNRYMKQFAAMESIVGNSNSLRSSLKGTFEGMMNAYKN